MIIFQLYARNQNCPKANTTLPSLERCAATLYILSPQLFNLYINDLHSEFENTLSDRFVSPYGVKLDSLFLCRWSNHVIKIENRTTKLPKTKITVFQKRARKNSELRFLIDGQIIDVVWEYTYLGTRISSSGVSREHLKEKALHALFSLRRHINLRKLKISLACKTFDTMMSPILTHNSEIWGAYAKPDTKTSEASQIGKTHLQFCKRYSAVNNKASNITCRAEIGHFPLNVIINQKILNYMLYIHSKDEESFVKRSFLIGSLRYGDYGLRLRINKLLRMIKTTWLFIFPA